MSEAPQWVRAIAHDMRQPMSAIGMQLWLLRIKDAHQDDRQRAIETLTNAFGALQSQIDELFERTIAPDAPIRTVPTHVHEIVQDNVHLFAPLARQAAVQLTLTQSRPVRLVALSNSSYLTRVLQSILSNAIEHGASKSASAGSIDVAVRATHDTIQITVTDNGPGMPPTWLASNGRPDGSDTSRGFGLPNSRKLINALPGHAMQIHSSPGQTTRIGLTLPRMPNHQQERQIGIIPGKTNKPEREK